MPIAGRPFLDYVLSAAADAGLERIALVVAPDHDDLRALLRGRRAAGRVTVDFVVQPEPRGTADAVLAAERWSAGRPLPRDERRQPLSGERALGAARASPSRDCRGSIAEDLVRTGNIPADRVRAFALIEQDDQGCLTRIVEKPSARRGRAVGSGRPGQHELLALRLADLRRLPCRDPVGARRARAAGRGRARGRAWGTLQGRARRWSRARSVATRRRARRRTPVVRNGAATMTGERLAAQLTRHGLDAIEETRKRSLWDLALQHFSRAAGGDPASALWVPGRIEVFGKHTDYGGGRSLVGPVPRGFAFVARRRDDPIVSMTDAVRGEQFSIDLGPCRAVREGYGGSATGGRRLAASRRHRVAPLRGDHGAPAAAQLPRRGDRGGHRLRQRPPAVVWHEQFERIDGWVWRRRWCASATSRRGRSGAPRSRRRRTRPATTRASRTACRSAASSGDAGVGTHGGSEDHVALICGRAGHVSAWRFVPIHHIADVAVPAGWTFVIASSGVAAKKTGGARDAYNRLSSLASALLDLWNSAEPQARSLHAALATSAAAPERLATLVRDRPPFDRAQGRPFDHAQGGAPTHRRRICWTG